MTFNPKPGDIITVENGNKFTCCTHEQLNERYKHPKNEWDIYGIACDGKHGWEGWRGDGSNECIGYNIATIEPGPETLLPAPGERFITADGSMFLCVTPEDLLKTCPTADFSGRNYVTLGLLISVKTGKTLPDWQSWPCKSAALKIVEIVRDLPAESVQAIAEARQIKADKVCAAPATRKFNPKPGDTIVTGNYAYVCCTREYLEMHYGIKLGYSFDIFGYHPSFGTGTGASAMGWDAAGKSGRREIDDDIKAVITAQGNKPKFKGVTTKQNLLDHLASLDGDHVRIRINDDHSISIE